MAQEATGKTGRALVLNLVPDVCLTPLPSDPSVLAPLPYNIAATLDDAVGEDTSVTFGGAPAFTTLSRVSHVVGNEEGTGGGVISGVNLGACRPIQFSPTISVGAGQTVMNGALFWMNCNGPDGPGNTIGEVMIVTESSGGLPLGLDVLQLKAATPMLVPETEEEWRWLAGELDAAPGAPAGIGLPAGDADPELVFDPAFTRYTLDDALLDNPWAGKPLPRGSLMDALQSRRHQAWSELSVARIGSGRGFPPGTTLLSPGPPMPAAVDPATGLPTWPSWAGDGASLAGGVASAVDELALPAPWMRHVGPGANVVGVIDLGVQVSRADGLAEKARTAVAATGGLLGSSLASSTVAVACGALTAPFSGPAGPIACIVITGAAGVAGGRAGTLAGGGLYDTVAALDFKGPAHDPSRPLPVPAGDAADHHHPPATETPTPAGDVAPEETPVAEPAPTPAEPIPIATPHPTGG